MSTSTDARDQGDFSVTRAEPTAHGLAYRIEFRDEQVADSLLTVLKELHGMLHEAWSDSHRRRLEALTEALVEARLPLSPAEQHQADMAAELRLRLLQDFGGLLSAEEVAERSHSRARNRAALASKWKREGRIFTLPYQGRELFPAFQFDPHSHRPLPGVARLLQTARERLTGWSLVYWLLTPNAWLPETAHPIEYLESDPEAVCEALTTQLNRANAF